MADMYQSKWLTDSDSYMLARARESMVNFKEKIDEFELARQAAEERIEKMKKPVCNQADLLDKYEEYGPVIESGVVTLRKEFPVDSLSRLIFDCNRLELKLIIDSTGECLYNATH